MKLVRIVAQLLYEPGIYGYQKVDLEQIKESQKDNFLNASSLLTSIITASSKDAASATILGLGSAVLGSFTPLAFGLTGALLLGSAIRATNDFFRKNPTAKQGKWGRQHVVNNVDSGVLDYLNYSLVFHHNTISRNYKDAASRPEFYGAFSSPKQLQKVLEADGTNSEIVVMSVETARKYFEHTNHGIFSPGIYVPHPKKLQILVPFENYHSILLKEVDEEFVRFFSFLGAKRISISTLEGVGIDGSGTIPKVKAEAKANLRLSKAADKIYEFYPENCNPEDALRNNVWIQDHPKMLTFYETRRSFRLKRFEETLTMDTSFGVDIDVLLQFNSAFKWEKSSKYLYEVDFFSKRELENHA